MDHQVEVHLALAAVNTINSSQSRFAICPSEASLPYKILKRGENSKTVANHLFTELTKCPVDFWFIIRQIGVVDQVKEDIVVILYGIMIPEVIPLLDKSIEWVNFETLSKYPILLKMMGQACNYYKVNS